MVDLSRLRKYLYLLILLGSLEAFCQNDPFEVRVDSGFITQALDQSQALQNSFLTINNSISAAQSFTVGLNGDLFKITVMMGSGSPGGNFVLTLYAGSSPIGSPLSTQIFNVNSTGIYTILLTTPISVLSGQVYTMTLTVQGGNNLSGDWYKQNTNVYSGGTAFIGTGSYTPLMNDDMVFATYVQNPDSAGVTRLRITDEGYLGTKDYLFPKYRGTVGQVLMADGMDSVKWQIQKIKLIADADEDTKIQVEKNFDEDIIRLDLAGSEAITIHKNGHGDAQMEFFNSQYPFGINVFIGKWAGQYNSSGKFNVGIGEEVLKNLSSGEGNTAIGTFAAANNSTGSFNTMVGSGIFGSNSSGGSNTGIGVGCLNYNSTGNDNMAGRFNCTLFKHNRIR
jgi:hypothetical protein